MQALEAKIGRYDALLVSCKQAQQIARKLLGAAAAQALQQLQAADLLRVEAEAPMVYELQDVTTDLAAPLAARLWQYLCADPALDEPGRLRAWLRKAAYLRGHLAAPQELAPSLTARLVAAATAELLAAPDVQGWEPERARFFGDYRLHGALLYPKALPSGWKTLPVDRPLGQQLLWASRQHYELNGDDSREPLHELVALVVEHDAWDSDSATYPKLLRLLRGLSTRPYLLLSAATAFHYRGADRLPWLSEGRVGFGGLGVLRYLQHEGRRNHEVAEALAAGYAQMTNDVRNQLFTVSLMAWVAQPGPACPQWVATVSYYLHQRYVQAYQRGATDAVREWHRAREAQWLTALQRAFGPYPKRFEQLALPVLEELRALDATGVDRYAGNHLAFSLPLLAFS